MRKRPAKLTAGGLLVGCAFALAWYFLAPSSLGGETSYVVTHGVSMEPQFHTGDLAILRAAPDYQVGDVVGYRSGKLGAVVMHRIIADDSGVYTLKGDNNNWTDPDHPTKADLVGRLAVRVPDGGRYLAALDSAPGRGVAGGVLALLLLGGAGRARRRRALRTSGRHRAPAHRAPARGTQSSHGASAPPRPTADLQARPARRLPRGPAAAAVLGCIAMAGAGSWLMTQPPTTPASRTLVIEQTGTFGYAADVASSVVYPDGKLRSGEPIFTQIAHAVDFSFDYHAAAALHGTIALSAALVGPSGWRTPLATSAAAPVTGGDGHATVRVDLAAARSALDAFTAATGVKATSASLVLTPKLDATGTVGGQPTSAVFDGKLTLAAGANQLTVVSTPNEGGASAAPANPLLTSAPLDVKTPTTASRTLHALSWHISVAAARIAVGAGLLATLGWLLVALLGSRRSVLAEDDVEAALRRYGDRIVDAEPLAIDGPVVDLTSLSALHSIAERYDRVILHTTRGARHSYLVRDELSWYRYDIRPDRPQHAARRDNSRDGADVVVLDAPVIRLDSRAHAVDILPGVPAGIPAGGVGPAAWANGYARAS